MAVTGLSRATLHRYLRGDVAEALRYVAVAQQMIVSLRSVSGADGCADCDALQRCLDAIACRAVCRAFPTPKSSKTDTPDLQTAEPRHLLVRDEHFHGAKVVRFYESSKYFGKKVSEFLRINRAYLAVS